MRGAAAAVMARAAALTIPEVTLGDKDLELYGAS